MWDTHLSIVFHIRLHVSKTDNFAGSNSNLSTTFLFLSTISEVHPVKEVPVARWWTTYSDLKILMHTTLAHIQAHKKEEKLMDYVCDRRIRPEILSSSSKLGMIFVTEAYIESLLLWTKEHCINFLVCN